MNDALKMMLDHYDCRSSSDYENALKEIIQEISLLGLWRSKFFEKAAFYGGSALRILYGLDRFSEDMDFSLLVNNKKFSWSTYADAIEHELKSFGFSVSVEEKKKDQASNIDSAFIKADTLQNMLVIDTPGPVVEKIHSRNKLKIKLEIDVNPPMGFAVEAKYLFHPVPFSVNAYAPPDLFAGKLHAVLCRPWANRIKGRDWYDLIWYVSKDIPIHIKHLEARMRQTADWAGPGKLTQTQLKKMLVKKIMTVDFGSAKKDVETFIKDPSSLLLWSKEYFLAVCDKIRVI